MAFATTAAVVGTAVGANALLGDPLGLGAGSGGNGTQAGQTSNAAAEKASQIAGDQWDYYKSNYQPLESNLIGQAQAAGSPEEFARARGAANADVTGAFNTARNQTKSRMESYGINPGSPAYQSGLASADLAEGATKAGALTAADNNTRNLAYSKALDVVGIGRNIPAQSAASASNASNAATGASKNQFAQNQTNMANTGYGLNTLSNSASKWFGTPGSSANYGANGQIQAPTSFGDTYSLSDQAYGAKGGKVQPHAIGYADGGEVEDDLAGKEGYQSKALPPKLDRAKLSFSGPTRPRLALPTGDRDSSLTMSADVGVSGGLRLKRAGIEYRKNFADGGAVIDAEKTGDGTYDATALKGVLQKRGLNPAMAHGQAHAAAARHKGAITPHMRRFAGGGGVGAQGLEGPDASNMGELQGPGTETSDSVPAQIDGQQPAALSTGEFVMNAEVPKLTGDEILQAINQAGLQKRGEAQPAANEAPDDGMQAYRRGGPVTRYAHAGI